MTERMQHKLAQLEAVLFTTHEPLQLKDLTKILGVKESTVLHLINILEDKYNKAEHGVMLSKTGGYRLTVKDQYIEKVTNLTPHADMSRGVLRVLSIISYHEPVEQSEIVKVIGNRTYEYVKELIERGLIKEEKKGRTKLLRTTPHFEEYFNIKKEHLKKEIEEIKEYDKEHPEHVLEQKEEKAE
jgi:segregation and condensation protein B